MSGFESSQSPPPHTRGGSPSPSPSSGSTTHTRVAGSHRSLTVQASSSSQSASFPQGRPISHPRVGWQLSPAAQSAGMMLLRQLPLDWQTSSVQSMPSSHELSLMHPGGPASISGVASSGPTSEITLPSIRSTPKSEVPLPVELHAPTRSTARRMSRRFIARLRSAQSAVRRTSPRRGIATSTHLREYGCHWSRHREPHRRFGCATSHCARPRFESA